MSPSGMRHSSVMTARSTENWAMRRTVSCLRAAESGGVAASEGSASATGSV